MKTPSAILVSSSLAGRLCPGASGRGALRQDPFKIDAEADERALDFAGRERHMAAMKVTESALIRRAQAWQTRRR